MNISDAFFILFGWGFFKGEKNSIPLQFRFGKLVQPGADPVVTLLKTVEARTAAFHLV